MTDVIVLPSRPITVSPQSNSSGQIDAITTIVKEWTHIEKTGKVILNFNRGRLGTIVKEETLRLPK